MPERLSVDARDLVLTAATEEAAAEVIAGSAPSTWCSGSCTTGAPRRQEPSGCPSPTPEHTRAALDVAALAAIGVRGRSARRGSRRPSSAGRRPPVSFGARRRVEARHRRGPSLQERTGRGDARPARPAGAGRALTRPRVGGGALGVDPAQVRKRLAAPTGGRLSGWRPCQTTPVAAYRLDHISRPRLTARCAGRAGRCRRGRGRLPASRSSPPSWSMRLGSRAHLGAAGRRGP